MSTSSNTHHPDSELDRLLRHGNSRFPLGRQFRFRSARSTPLVHNARPVVDVQEQDPASPQELQPEDAAFWGSASGDRSIRERTGPGFVRFRGGGHRRSRNRRGPFDLPGPFASRVVQMGVGAVALCAAVALIGVSLLQEGIQKPKGSIPRATARPVGLAHNGSSDGTAPHGSVVRAPGSSSDSPRSNGATAESSEPGGASADTAPAPTKVVVHVAGAVTLPGVVELPVGARVNDAVRVAGGFRTDADPNRINLAAVLSDGSRLYVPALGEVVASVDSGAPASGSSSGGPWLPGAAVAPVNLNSATAAELDGLPGVGPSTANAILEFRKKSGGFTSVEQLQEVSGIGPAKFEKLLPLVVV